MDDIPEKLFHYTSLESLALILRNQTLRLMPLTGMDDPQENLTRDIANLGKFFFASCWTDDRDESIPMWKMYASLESGVRIALPANPFQRHPATKESLAAATGFPLNHIEVESGSSTLIPIEDLARGLMTPYTIEGKGLLQKVIYTSDKSRLEPTISSIIGDQAFLSFNDFGRVKNKKWEFQHEWRYLMPIFPFELLGNPETAQSRFSLMVSRLINGTLAPACSYYDLRLDSECLQKIEITPSPRMSAGNLVLLNTLLAHHGLSSRIRESELVGLL